MIEKLKVRSEFFNAPLHLINIPLNEFNGGNNFPIFDRFSPTVENKPKFSNYLYFNVSVKTNTLMQTTDRYSTEQQELHDKIKSLYESGMAYRKITKHLSDNNILTPNGKTLGKIEVI